MPLPTSNELNHTANRTSGEVGIGAQEDKTPCALFNSAIYWRSEAASMAREVAFLRQRAVRAGVVWASAYLSDLEVTLRQFEYRASLSSPFPPPAGNSRGVK